MADNDNVRHGLDDDPNNDPSKGAKLGGVGGAVTGLAAGSMVGPGGAIIGAIVGGIAGALGSKAAVKAVDKVDNDNTVTGLGGDDNRTNDYDRYENDWRSDYDRNYANSGTPYDNNYQHAYRYGHDLGMHSDYQGKNWDEVQNDARRDWETSNPGTWDTYQGPIRNSWERSRTMSSGSNTPGGGVAYADNAPGIQTGGHNADGSPDTRGITEKMADTVTGDQYDDKTGKRID